MRTHLNIQRLAVMAVALMIPVGAMTGTASAAVETRKPPPSCIKALDAAQDIRSQTADLIKNVADFFTNVHDNASAHAAGGDAVGFINQLTTDTQTLTGQFNAATPSVQAASDRLETYETRCRAGR